jgi:uncharacterized protein YuzE
MKKKRPMLEYDGEADALYVALQHASVRETRPLDDHRLADAEDGTIVGIEFIDVSGGVDLAGLGPEKRLVDELITTSGVPVKILAG